MKASEDTTLSRKRKAGEEESNDEPKLSPAARFNQSVLMKLQRALDADPETNLLDLFPNNYAGRLAGRKEGQSTVQNPAINGTSPAELLKVEGRLSEIQHIADDPYDLRLTPATIVFPLSETVQSLLRLYDTQEAGPNSNLVLSSALAQVTKVGEVIRPLANALGMSRKVIKYTGDLILKMDKNDGQHTEYSTMQYLEHQKPEFPAPRAHGLMVVGP
jgi:hypothetical protein